MAILIGFRGVAPGERVLMSEGVATHVFNGCMGYDLGQLPPSREQVSLKSADVLYWCERVMREFGCGRATEFTATIADEFDLTGDRVSRDVTAVEMATYLRRLVALAKSSIVRHGATRAVLILAIASEANANG